MDQDQAEGCVKMVDYFLWMFGRKVRYGKHLDQLARLSVWIWSLALTGALVCIFLIPLLVDRPHLVLNEILPVLYAVFFLIVSFWSLSVRKKPLSDRSLSTMSEEYREIAKRYLDRNECGVLTLEILEEEKEKQRLDKKEQIRCSLHEKQKNLISQVE
jgi:hypothetical protein